MKSPTVGQGQPGESRWIGRVLRDKWRIEKKIARGGMGTVFVAVHKNNGSTAAIKILHPEFARDSDTRGRFLQEGYAANQVNHPGVVRILDDDTTEEGHAYLVMELLEGELLEQRRIRKGGKLPLVEVYEFADQLLDVLSAAHQKGIVHRDVKPDNIFLTKQGKLKVLDFGFAQMKSSYRTEQTATGFLLGTPGFMAPEQAIGNRPLIDAQTDVWAVGATMFLLITGEPVHAGESAAEMLVAAANFSVRSIQTLDPHLPTKLAAVIDKALAFKKADRWPDAKSMQTALRLVPGRQATKEPIRQSIPDDGPNRLFVSNSNPPPPIPAPRPAAGAPPVVQQPSVPPTSTKPAPPRPAAGASWKPPRPQGVALGGQLDEPTVMNQPILPEEIEDVELQEAPAEKATPYVRQGKAPRAPHAADRDGPTTTAHTAKYPHLADADHKTPFVHPADQEKPTLAVDGDGPTLARPSPFASPHGADDRNDSTVIMESRPAGTQTQKPPPVRPAFDLPQQQQPQQQQRQQKNTAPHRPPMGSDPQWNPQQPPTGPSFAPPIPMQQPYGTPPPPQAGRQPSDPNFPPSYPFSQPMPPMQPAASTGSRAIVFVLVVGITMVVVILTGLLVILGSD